MQRMLAICLTFMSVLLTACGGNDGETPAIYPAAVTYQLIYPTITSSRITVRDDDIRFYADSRLVVNLSRTDVSDGSGSYYQPERVCKSSSLGICHKEYALNNDYSAGVTLTFTTNTPMWHNEISTLSLPFFPALNSPLSDEVYSPSDTITLLWDSSNNMQANGIHVRSCGLYGDGFAGSYFIPLAADEGMYQLQLSTLLPAAQSLPCSLKINLQLAATGAISPGFAGGELVATVITDTRSVTVQ